MEKEQLVIKPLSDIEIENIRNLYGFDHEVETQEDAKSIENLNDSELILIKSENVVLYCNEDENGKHLHPFDLEDVVVKETDLYKQAPALNFTQNIRMIIKDFFIETNNILYLIYVPEYSYFTLIENASGINEEWCEKFISLLSKIGEPVDIDKEDNDILKFFIRVKDKEKMEDCSIYYGAVIPYDNGIVKL